jgi:hypothetical protein
MKKLLAFLVTVVMVVSLYSFAVGSGLSTNSVYLWRAKPIHEYEMITNKNTMVLDLQVWTIARYIEECARRLRLANPKNPATFEFSEKDRQDFTLGTITVDTVPLIMGYDQESMLISLKLGLVNAHINTAIVKTGDPAYTYGDKIGDTSWYDFLELTLELAQLTLDNALYLPEHDETFRNAWMD